MTACFIWPVVRPLFRPRGALFAGLIALAAGCGGNHPVARGFDSQEVYPVRDSSLVFDGIGAANTLLYSTGANASGQGAMYWSLDLATGAIQAQGNPSTTPPTTTPTGPYSCSFTYNPSQNGVGTLVISNTSDWTTTEIDNVVSYDTCPGADQVISLFQLDATSGNLTFSSGPFSQLQVVPLAIDPQTIEWWYAKAGGITGAAVQAGTPSQPDALGLYTIDVPSGTVTTDVPPVPASTAWAPGATPSGSLQSSSLAATSSAISPTGTYFFYPRTMADGGTTMFAGPFTTGAASELALFALPAGSPPSAPPYRALPDVTVTSKTPLPALFSWQLAGATGNLLVWNDANHQVTTCPSASQAYLGGLLSPDGSRALFVTPQGYYSYQGSGPLALFTLGGAGSADSCTSLVGSGVVTAGFAPDSSALFWLTQLPSGDDQLWIANVDGSGPQMIGTGALDDIHFISGTDRLEMVLGGDSLWLDVHDNPTNLHYIAEQVFGLEVDVIGSWVVTGYDYNTQDETGTLGVVNRDDGTKRVISPAVAQYIVLKQSAGADAGATLSNGATNGDPDAVFTVIYQVRGRNPSPQDGIWVATVRAADLQ